jgi:hypothetical protein
MTTFDRAHQLVTTYFPDIQLQPQLVSDWNGSFPLPEPIVDYYAVFGPVDTEIDTYGNPYFLPSLANLWSLQAGYRYDGRSHTSLPGWNDDWLVIAEAGGDPFICSRTTKQVAFAEHGIGTWKPDWVFDNLEQMVTSLLILGSVRRVAGADFTDSESYVKVSHYAEALRQLTNLLPSVQTATDLLALLGWVSDG